MSRAYRVSVAESLRRHVQVEDGICSALELLPVLPAEQTAELLGVELERKGFVRRGQAAVRVMPGGVEVSIDLSTGAVKARVAAELEVRLELNRSSAVASEHEVKAEEERLRAGVKNELESQAELERERLRQKATARLEGVLRDLRDELDGVVNRVTAEALKRRAAQLGEVEEVTEDPITGSLTIRVRV